MTFDKIKTAETPACTARKSRRVSWILILGSVPVVLFACILFGASGFGIPDTNTVVGRAILGLRVNRVVTAMLVGAALACAGTVFQALLRNPLAEPYVLGVSSGAGLGAALAILTGLGTALGVMALPVCAFVAAGLTLLLVFSVAGGSRSSVYSLILSGVIVSSIGSSILMFLVATAPVEGLHSVIWWMLGNLQPTSPGLLAACAVVIGLGLLGTWMLAPELNTMTLGREMAHHVGVRPSVVVTVGLLLSTLVTSAAVAMAGLIGFVGLIVPHVMRSLVGPDHRRLIPVAALGGGLFLAVCDAFARTILMPREIPVGVVTAICGGPFFLFVLRFRRKQGWIE